MNKTDKLIQASTLAYNEAKRWKKSYLMLLENIELYKESTILCAYSCELFLKSLLMYYGEDVLGERRYHCHNLKKLFNSLNIEIQKEIKLPIEIIPKKINFDNGANFSYKNFSGILELAANSYENLRYDFEAATEDRNLLIFRKFLKEFNCSLEKVCNKIFDSNEVI